LASAAIAIPVIAATNGYVVAQTFGWRASLANEPRNARSFYQLIFASLGAAAVLALMPISTMSFLYWTSVVAGLATPITLAFMLVVARDRNVMGGRPIGVALAGAGWVVTAVVTAASLAFVVSIAPSLTHP
jgi:Mn2+/Fe2+ NRAMP family transporter